MHAHFPSALPRRWLVLLGLLVTTALSTVAAFGQPQAQGPVPTGQVAEYRIRKGEDLYLRSETGHNITEVVVSQPGIVDIEPVNPATPKSTVRLTGREAGTVRVTMASQGDERPTVVNVTVLPTAAEVAAAVDATARRQEEARQRAFLAVVQRVTQQFPTASIRLSRAGEAGVIVTGYVDAAEEIDPIVRFIQASGYPNVTNHITVGGVQQVQLEVCVARVDREELRHLGFNFLAANPNNFLGSQISNLIGTPNINPGQGIGTFSGDNIVTGTTNLLFGFSTRNSAFLGFLEALRTENLAKILANPTLTTLSGRPATFLVGGEQPYPVPASLGQPPSIDFKQFGTALTFVPVVLADGRIRIEVEPEVSRLDFANGVTIAGTQVPQFQTQRVHATVELASGQTYAIGGLLQNQVDATTDKTPILGDLPFVGVFWRRVRYDERETELLILVTPRLVDPMDCAQRQTKLPGQETRTPTDFELFLEGILEAPRGQRPLCVDGVYRPAHYWAGPYCNPCGNQQCGSAANCASGCNGCASTAPATMPSAEMASMPQVTRPEAMPKAAPAAEATPVVRGSIVPPATVSRESETAANPVRPSVVQTEGTAEFETKSGPMRPEPTAPAQSDK